MRVCILGGSFASGNLGLEALTCALVNGIWRAAPEARITAFDFVWSRSEVQVETPDGPRAVERLGLNDTRRLWHSTALARMGALKGARLLDGPGRRALREADLVIDISGGDSFTDLYGLRRLRAICAAKELVLDLGTPLVLGPQTYGPYAHEEGRTRARAILTRATQVWARDVDSRVRAQELVGEEAGFVCEQGVDLAFALPPSRSAQVGGITIGGDQRPVGLNVSGLLWNGGEARARSLGLRVDYRALMRTLVERLLEEGAPRVLLVPHVLARPGNEESDQQAAEELLAGVDGTHRNRIDVARGTYTASEAKALIGGCSWFAGSRMHATIAGLSTGVPTTGLAYSLKFRGVFESAGVPDCSLDLRALETDEVLEQSLAQWRRREATREALEEPRRRLRSEAAQQVASMVQAARGGRA